jgi:hypothetical protein
MSIPLTLRDLKPGETFIFWPEDGDDSGHGGYRGSSTLYEKIAPYHPGKDYHESAWMTCREYVRKYDALWPLSSRVIRVCGVCETIT